MEQKPEEQKSEEQIDQEYYLIQLQELGDTSEKLKEISQEIQGVVESLKKFDEQILSANFSIPLFIQTLPEIQKRSLKISESLMLFQKSTGDDDFKDHLLYVAIYVNKKLIDLLSKIIDKFLQFRLTDDIKSIDNDYNENVFMIQQTSKQLNELEDIVKRNTINPQSTSKGGKSRRRRHRRSRYHRNSRHANKNNKSRKGRKSSTQRMRNRISGRSKRGG
jgi:cell division protein ZapA (FtsZ GTPase activity inhibitor)